MMIDVTLMSRKYEAGASSCLLMEQKERAILVVPGGERHLSRYTYLFFIYLLFYLSLSILDS